MAHDRATSSCCHTSAPAGRTDLLTTTTSAAAPTSADVAECPVMPGSSVVKADAEAAGLFRDHEGRRYWFCCAGCGPRFDADPAKYAVTT
ncbi:YHS domain-containing protein [Georgenia subflava]|uniref:YHS domain-containing protein n=1 Tax=Georgenia subflava TaxID=1622177 RepID=A0A6N7EDE5_9MICO|nr:YHS domain-containing protein [Georgenia subflava]MPV36020.1 YHS domain-containing protein [Georgenia subflava]